MPDSPSNDQIDLFYSDLGRRIGSARRAANLTQGQLATSAGLTRSSIANVEAGRQRVPLHVFAAMASVLKVPMVDLMPESIPDRRTFTIDVPIYQTDPPGTRAFVEGALASIGLAARWVPSG